MKILVKNKDELPNDLQDGATEVGEDDSKMFEVDVDLDTRPLRKALKEERATVKELKEQVEKFEGIDATEARTAIEAQKSGKKGDEALKAAHEQAIERLKGEQKTALSAMQRKIDRQAKAARAVEIIQAAGGNHKLLRHHVESRLRLERDDDGEEAKIVFLDENSEPAVDRNEVPLKQDAFIKLLHADPDLAPAFGGKKEAPGVPPGPGSPDAVNLGSVDWDKQAEDISTGKIGLQ